MFHAKPPSRRRARRRQQSALIALWLGCALQGAAAAPPTQPAAPSAAIEQAEREARDRHTRAMQDCAGSAQPAACRRDADATLHQTLRDTAGERQRGATPPPTTAQDVQRVQRQRLFNDLERAAPRPLPTPHPDPLHP